MTFDRGGGKHHLADRGDGETGEEDPHTLYRDMNGDIIEGTDKD